MSGRARMLASLSVLVLGLVLLAPANGVLSLGQEKDGAEAQGKKDNNITVTGCLQKGSSDEAYTIAGPNGTSYQLTGGKVALKDHVGHKVTITGKPAKAEGGSSPEGRLEVTNLKVVSTTCS